MHDFLNELQFDPLHPMFKNWDFVHESKTLRNPITPNVLAWDFVHLFKTVRNHLLDDFVTFLGGFKVSVQNFHDLLDKVRTVSADHSSGFHISEDHLLVENTDRQDVTMAMHLLSERTVAAFRKYFPINEVSKE